VQEAEQRRKCQGAEWLPLLSCRAAFVAAMDDDLNTSAAWRCCSIWPARSMDALSSSARSAETTRLRRTEICNAACMAVCWQELRRCAAGLEQEARALEASSGAEAGRIRRDPDPDHRTPFTSRQANQLRRFRRHSRSLRARDRYMIYCPDGTTSGSSVGPIRAIKASIGGCGSSWSPTLEA